MEIADICPSDIKSPPRAKLSSAPMRTRPWAGPGAGAHRHISGIKQGTPDGPLHRRHALSERRVRPRMAGFRPARSGQPSSVSLGSWAVGEAVELGQGANRFKPGDLVHGSMLHQPKNGRRRADLFALARPASRRRGPSPTRPCSPCGHAQVKVGDRVAVFGCGVLGCWPPRSPVCRAPRR